MLSCLLGLCAAIATDIVDLGGIDPLIPYVGMLDSRGTQLHVSNDTGTALLVAVSQERDLQLVVQRKDRVARIDSTLGRYGPEQLVLMPSEQLKLKIVCEGCGEESTRFELSSRVIPQSELEIYRLSELGLGFIDEPDEGRRKLSQAYEMAKRSGNQALEARVMLLRAGFEAETHGDWDRAADYSEVAQNLFAETGDWIGKAHANLLGASALLEGASGIGDESESSKRYEKAGLWLGQADTVFGDAGDVYTLNLTRNYKALSAYYRGEWAIARSTWAQVAEVSLSVGELGLQSLALENLGVLDLEQGFLLEARRSLLQALDLQRVFGNRELQAATLGNLGMAAASLGLVDEAIEHFSNAAELSGETRHRAGEARGLHGIGLAYLNAGDAARAERFFQQSLVIQEDVFDGRGQASTLKYLGQLSANNGRYAEAESLLQRALTSSSSPADQARITLLRSEVAVARNDFDVARSQIAETKVLAADLGTNELKADLAMVEAGYFELNDEILRADEAYRSALKLYTLQEQWFEVANAHYRLALLLNTAGNKLAAVPHAEAAGEYLLRARERLVPLPIRTLSLSSRQSVFDLLIGLHVDLGRSASTGEARKKHFYQALSAAEESRMREMMDVQSDISEEMLKRANVKLVAEYKERSKELIALSNQIRRFSVTTELGTALLDEREALEIEVRVLQRGIRNSVSSGRLAVAPNILTAEEVVESVDEGTLRLHYVLGEDRSFAFWIDSGNLGVLDLPSGALVHQKVLDARAEMLEADNDTGAVQELAQMVWTPVVNLVHGKSIRLIPDGSLHAIPFEVLARPLQDGELAEVTYAPTASVAEGARRSSPLFTPKNLLIYADPVYGARDSRLLERPEHGEDELSRLTGSLEEARAITRLVPDSIVVDAFDATVSDVTSRDLSTFSILHFASHAVVNLEDANASNIALSAYNASGERLANALYYDDVLGLNLESELVVLSACETAIGPTPRGEAAVSLAQAFLLAGSARVLMSLWQVGDRATAYLMTEFYRNLFVEGMQPAMALRKAKERMRASRRWSSPRHWAGFVLLES